MGAHHRQDDTFDPFVVAGHVQGRDLRIGAASPAAAHATAHGWRRSDPTARVCWYLHPDWPEPVTALVRLRPGWVGEHQRTVHLVPLYPGVRQGGVLRTWCAQLLDLHTVEWPNVGQGMPCLPCLLRIPSKASPQEAVDTAVPALQVPADQNAPAVTVASTVPTVPAPAGPARASVALLTRVLAGLHRL